MGFSSQRCKGCDRDLLNLYAASGNGGALRWLSEAVVITPDNVVIKGTYDGYGGLEDFEIPDTVHEGVVCARYGPSGKDNEVWHEACWELAGSPTTFTGPSPWSEGGRQGHWHTYSPETDPDPRRTA